MKKKLKWAAIIAGVLIYLLWAYSGEHETYPHAALGLFIFGFWWEMNDRLGRIQQAINEANKRLSRMDPRE